ncbi:MAG: hypothetical protein ABIH49_03580 [archaeon]
MEIKILASKKHVFWQAFFLTVLFFSLGLVFGVYVEQLREDSLSVTFYNSETSLYDAFALGNLIGENISCNELMDAHINFADKIYEEARELEKFDEANKLTESVKVIHKKYDLLRTLLWMNVISLREKCPEVNSVVYLYIYDSDDVYIKSNQIVWSRILQDLKEEKSDSIILIPIAVNQDISSLDYLLKKYGVKNYPAVIINGKNIIYSFETAEELENYLD